MQPIEYGLGYRSQTLTLSLTLSNLKLTVTLPVALKVTIMYTVQNDTEIKLKVQHSVICKLIFLGMGVAI